MLEGPGGGGTSWESMTIETMRGLIQNPDVSKHWELLTGWQRSADLILEHRSEVENYRANLTAAWPPEKSKAAFAYVQQLDVLISNLSETYDAAVANHTAFSSATLSISLAKKDVETIYQEYTNNAQLLANFTATQQQSSSTPTPTPSPSGEEPPVAPGRQEELRQKAALRLSAVSADLAQAQVRIVNPPPYEPETVMGDDPKPTGGYVPPPIPPIIPIPASGEASTANLSRPSASFPTTSTTQGQLVSPASLMPGSASQQPGLVLGGTTTPVATSPSPGIAPMQPALPVGTSPITSPGLPPTMNALLPSGGAAPIAPAANGLGRAAGLPREGLLRPGTPGAGEMRAMPPGGLIGGTPGVGIGGAPGRSAGQGTTRTGARRINPVGGVIGEEGTLGRTAGRGVAGEHAAGISTPYGQVGGNKRGRRDEAGENRWDPDNPWETAEGVDPVVLPPREQRIDPGPAIGLS
jgi:hypothetical protein